MQPNPNGQANASGLGWQNSRCSKQKQYWQKLQALSLLERQDYLRIYDAIAKAKNITPVIQLMLDSDLISNQVSVLAEELAALVGKLTKACLEHDWNHYQRLHQDLDDINIAVNAWLNSICLRHSSAMYQQYRWLMHSAKCMQLN